MLRKIRQRLTASLRSGDTPSWWMNRLMQEVIPFNRPHRIQMVKVAQEEVVVSLPLRRRNTNHLGTMHACALATAAEYASGLCVLATLDMSNHRLIMSDLQVHYPRRAESDCRVVAAWDDDSRQRALQELAQSGRHQFEMKSVVFDELGEVVAEALVTWHVKRLTSRGEHK